MTDILRRGLSSGEEFFPEKPLLPAEAGAANANTGDTAMAVDNGVPAYEDAESVLARSYLCETPDPFPATHHNYTNVGAVIVAFSQHDR